MTELEMKTEAEVEDFTDELSDEALDRAEGAADGTDELGHPLRPVPSDVSDVSLLRLRVGMTVPVADR